MPYKRIRYLNSEVHVYEFNQANRHISLEHGKHGILEKLSRMALGAEVKINCGFFAFNASSEHYGTWSPNWTTVCYDEAGDQLLKFYDPETMDVKLFNQITAENTLTFGASYTLVEDGKESIRNFEPFPHYKQRHPRTILIQRHNRNMMFVVVDGRRWNSGGMTAKEQAQLCLYLGARCAVNFDGGGSSEMVVGNTIMNKPSDGGERLIGSCLVAYKES
jgi:hypothetical protein